MPILFGSVRDSDPGPAMSGGRRSAPPDPIQRRLDAIERHLRGLDADLSVLSSAVRLGERLSEPEESDPEIDPSRFKDVVWSCDRCSSRLAVYDPISDLLRVRHRDLQVQVRTGPGGMVRAICRNCGHINEIHDESDSPGSVGATPEGEESSGVDG